MARQRRDAFRALADGTRRNILTLLKKRGARSAGEIAHAFPRISRPAVSRHLRVLRHAGLVTAKGVGREQQYTLAIAALARVHHDWFGQFAALWDGSFSALKEQVESARIPAGGRTTARTTAQKKGA
jgi:DNA-binding transcriptional ArsR family regulator